jgi:peptidoglycan/xylan/chitin deacetylase (PgdA/CDA1 family)
VTNASLALGTLVLANSCYERSLAAQTNSWAQRALMRTSEQAVSSQRGRVKRMSIGGLTASVWLVTWIVATPAHGDGHAGALRPAIRLAVTVDDLPGGGPEVLGYTHVQMVKDIIAVLQAHQVPHAAGFIVGEMLQTRPERGEALEAWVQAGFLVGNHTYSHEKIAQLGVQRFMEDIVKNRTVVDPLEKRLAQQHSYFRFPYLEEGTTRKERSALWQLLQSQRYTLVRASVTFSDTDWADAYLRCTHKSDKDSLDALDRSYLANAVAQLHWSVAAAREVLGHPIPHVLLVHVNMPTAKNLDALLRAYEAQGVQFVSLEQAMREPAYAAHYDVTGGDLLDQASTRLGRPHPPKLVEPDVLIDRICR